MHYKEIVGCEYLDNDWITKMIINYYKVEVEREIDKNKLDKMDNAIYRYISDYNFSKSLVSNTDFESVYMCKKDLTDNIMMYIVDYLDKYDLENVKTISNSRWI